MVKALNAELLAACKAVMQDVNDQWKHPDMWTGMCDAAIKKAEGTE